MGSYEAAATRLGDYLASGDRALLLEADRLHAATTLARRSLAELERRLSVTE